MISCAEAVRQLWDYLEEGVAAQDRALIEEHLKFCQRCCGAAEFAGELGRFMSSHASDELPPEVRQRLTGIMEELEG